jgi:hypothetical protein
LRRGPTRTTLIKCYLKAGAFFSILFISKLVSCSVFALHLLLQNSWHADMLRKNCCSKPCETLLVSLS